MKNYILDFLRRGAAAMGIGPVVLAVLYLILGRLGRLETLTVSQACTGIFSLSGLAFLAGGINALYQVERLPLMVAILIHGAVLYLGYLAVYLLNGWLDLGIGPVLVFTLVFVLGYLVIWAVIYSLIKRKTEWLNRLLAKNREN